MTFVAFLAPWGCGQFPPAPMATLFNIRPMMPLRGCFSSEERFGRILPVPPACARPRCSLHASRCSLVAALFPSPPLEETGVWTFSKARPGRKGFGFIRRQQFEQIGRAHV